LIGLRGVDPEEVLGMDRKDLQRLARIRLREARCLFKNGFYDGSYYLCGYALECAIKACIARKTKRHEFPHRQTVLDSYVHDLVKLIGTAGLKADFERELRTDPAFGLNWGVVKDWSEEARYQQHSQVKARDMYRAVRLPQHGVLQWIRRYW
jgi:HEPN domain-containing protein